MPARAAPRGRTGGDSADSGTGIESTASQRRAPARTRLRPGVPHPHFSLAGAGLPAGGPRRHRPGHRVGNGVPELAAVQWHDRPGGLLPRHAGAEPPLPCRRGNHPGRCHVRHGLAACAAGPARLLGREHRAVPDRRAGGARRRHGADAQRWLDGGAAPGGRLAGTGGGDSHRARSVAGPGPRSAAARAADGACRTRRDRGGGSLVRARGERDAGTPHRGQQRLPRLADLRRWHRQRGPGRAAVPAPLARAGGHGVHHRRSSAGVAFGCGRAGWPGSGCCRRHPARGDRGRRGDRRRDRRAGRRSGPASGCCQRSVGSLDSAGYPRLANAL